MAKITIAKELRHRINPYIYGHFIEEIGECVHDGLWAESPALAGLPRCDEARLAGVRQDVLDATSSLFEPASSGATMLRWPGGCYSDTYQWKDGIGAAEARPRRKNLAWSRGPLRFAKNKFGKLGPDVSNRFGTDEFLSFCSAVGADPYINVNYGSGTPEEAAEWVEYCNGAAESEWGAKRAEHHPEPYGVKYWGIANEIWAAWETGHEKLAKDYAEKYLRFAQAMRAKDPTIKLLACGHNPNFKNRLLYPKDAESWNETLLTAIHQHVDYLTVHAYYPTTASLAFFVRGDESFARNEQVYEAILAAPLNLEALIRQVWAGVERALGKDTHVRIALDEWNLWYYFRQAIKANWALMDGLFVASTLQMLQRLSPIVPLANFAIMVNVLGLIRTDDDGVVKTPSYHAFDLLKKTCFQNLIGCRVDCETYTNAALADIKATETPYLDANATISDDGKQIAVTVINKHYSKSIESELAFEGFDGRSYRVDSVVRLHHDDPFAKNSPSERERIAPVVLDGSGAMSASMPNSFEFPAHSLTLIRCSA